MRSRYQHERTFDSPETFYITLFHELVHSTGHQTRLNRQTLVEGDGMGGKVYSEEELVAEMGSCMHPRDGSRDRS